MSDDTKPAEDNEPEAAAAEDTTQPSPQEAANEAADAFKQGLGLLWKAAKSAADEIKKEVEKGGVTDALQQAGRDLETAATHAAKAVEGFVDRVGPKDSKLDKEAKAAGFPGTSDAQQVDADVPGDDEDGGVDPETGERRDMRIQVDDD